MRPAALIILAAVALASGARAEPRLAFPGAEGAGRFSEGGRGGVVLKVTNLEDAGPGSLRAAVEAKGPRVVVFETGGTIQLKTPLKISEGRITIAGQTAPGGGITLRDQPLIVSADDVVIRFIRSRLGDVTRVQTDAIDIVRGRRIILDHVSASWSVDETLSAGSRYKPPESGVYDVTVQWSIIAESLDHSAHDKGEHGYGSLIRGGHGARMSWRHNLWANHVARMPRPGNYAGPEEDPEGPLLEFQNNVFYNWGRGWSGYDADTAAKAAYDFIGNAYVPGPDSEGRIAFNEKNQLATAFFDANSMDGVVPADPWSLVNGSPPPGYRRAGPLHVAPWTPEPAATAYERVLAGAGASLVRDAVDARILAGVKARTGRIIDSQASVGGWPQLSAGARRKDSDGDGLPDAWEAAHRLDPRTADRAGEPIEQWLAALASGEARP